MEIKFENITLRDMTESDIADYVRWFTTDTEWTKTDAPWETIEPNEEAERSVWQKHYESVRNFNDSTHRRRFEIEYSGSHVGWVNSYTINEKFEWVSPGEAADGQANHIAIGIDICESDVWGKGIGTKAFRAFAGYNFKCGYSELYTQTWSGNTRMIRLAEKLGFVECNRKAGSRIVKAKAYDALTFKLISTKQNNIICHCNDSSSDV